MGVDRGLGAVVELELAEDVRDVGLHRPVGDPERGRDLLVGLSGRHELEDLALAWGEGAVREVALLATTRGALRAAVLHPAELVEHAPRDRRADEREALGDRTDTVSAQRRAHLLQEVTPSLRPAARSGT